MNIAIETRAENEARIGTCFRLTQSCHAIRWQTAPRFTHPNHHVGHLSPKHGCLKGGSRRMKMRKHLAAWLTFFLMGWISPACLRGESRPVDTSRSKITIRVFKSGLFSAFAHNHEIEAPVETGMVELTPNQSVQLKFDARKLRVLDPELAADKRKEVQETMLGPKVLDSGRFPEISYQSTAIEKIGNEHWSVRGKLTLHGQAQPVVVDVALKAGRYTGTAALKQRDFGMEPVSVAGGTVKVKDEIKIEFSIVLK